MCITSPANPPLPETEELQLFDVNHCYHSFRNGYVKTIDSFGRLSIDAA